MRAENEFTEALFEASLPRDTSAAVVVAELMKRGLTAGEAGAMRRWLGESTVMLCYQALGRTRKGADLSFADLCGSCCDGADVSRAKLEGAAAIDARFVNAKFDGGNLRGADFSGCELPGASFRDADLSSADFEGVELTGADFHGAKVGGAKFPGAIL